MALEMVIAVTAMTRRGGKKKKEKREKGKK